MLTFSIWSTNLSLCKYDVIPGFKKTKEKQKNIFLMQNNSYERFGTMVYLQI